MGLIDVREKNWKKGIRSYGDKNFLHVKRSVAQRYGFSDKIAPGMWVVSHVPSEDISSIGQVKFKDNVYAGDVLDLRNKEVLGKNSYVFGRGKKSICEVTGVSRGEYSSAPTVSPKGELVHAYSHEVSPRRIERFLDSVGLNRRDGFPNSYAMALSASSLVEFGAKSGLLGMHTGQTFDVHEGFKDKGLIQVLAYKGKVRGAGPGSFHKFPLRWIQNDRLKASGLATICLIDPSKISPPNYLRDFFVDLRDFFGMS